MSDTFRSLRSYNYRVWYIGSLVSNIGAWMQRIAQDWLVLAELTHRDATAVGVVMALQFGPMVLLLPLTGLAADRYDRRKLLFVTQVAMGLLALGLGLLVVTGRVRLWEVYGFALLLGCVAAFDAPARQAFVPELVGEADISNAVGLNSTAFNAARLIGPGIAGLLIAGVGTGWVFLLNAITFAATLGSLALLRLNELHPRAHAGAARASLGDGFRYVANRPDLKTKLLMMFLIGTFGLNFPIFISTMAVGVFHIDASRFGLLNSMMAVGSVTGALLTARRSQTHLAHVCVGLMVFGLGSLLAAVMPNYLLFGLVLMLVGVAAQSTNTSIFSLVQMSTEPAMRGRIMAIVLATALGGTTLGAPLVGWVANALGPRWGLVGAGIAGLVAAGIGTQYLRQHAGLRLHREAGRLRFSLGEALPPDVAGAAVDSKAP